MSIVTVQGWHCDVCGYEWLKSGKEPIRCASSKCRSRNWNQLSVHYQKAYKPESLEDRMQRPEIQHGMAQAKVLGIECCSGCGGLNGLHQKGCKRPKPPKP
jgi:hypothetical protein